MLLYFNSRIINNILTPNNINSGYFYPQVYPKEESKKENETAYQILVKTIESYSLINFEYAVFNISLDDIWSEKKEELRNIICNLFPISDISINFDRPSTLKEWREEMDRLIEYLPREIPTLVVMNHDHPFVDHDDRTFQKYVNYIFDENEINFGKVFYYSHAPEVISWAVNGRGKDTYIQKENGLFESSTINNWVDSIGVMSLETLRHVWYKAIFIGDYIGRIDWDGVTYHDLDLKMYVFPREFFKHYDGYGHITGIRLFSEMDLSKKFNLPFPNINILNEYYYQKWIDCFVIALRDYVYNNSRASKSIKRTFVEGVEFSIKLFKIGYFEEDITLGRIDNLMLLNLERDLRNKIYYNGNKLLQELLTDIILLKRKKSIWQRIDNVFENILPIYLYKVFIKLKFILKYLTTRFSGLKPFKNKPKMI